MKPRSHWLFLQALLTKRVPVYVQYAVTAKCNLNCPICNSNVSRAKEADLTLPEMQRLGQLLKKMRVSNLVLTGGEPFLRKDIVEVVALFDRMGFEVRLQSNGFLLTPELLEGVDRAGAKGITISLDSLHADVQDRITGFNGSHEKIYRALALISQSSFNKGKISAINTTVSRLNVTELPGLAQFATRLGLFISFIPLHSIRVGSGFVIRKNNKDFEFLESDDEVIDRTYSKLLEMKQQGYLIYNSSRFLRETPGYLKQRSVRWRCDSPYLYFAVTPSGRFAPCVDLDSDISMLAPDFLKDYRRGTIQSMIRASVDCCEGCMYACWPEFTFLVRDWRTLIEQAVQLRRQTKARSHPLTDEEIRSLAETSRGEGFGKIWSPQPYRRPPAHKGSLHESRPNQASL